MFKFLSAIVVGLVLSVAPASAAPFGVAYNFFGASSERTANPLPVQLENENPFSDAKKHGIGANIIFYVDDPSNVNFDVTWTSGIPRYPFSSRYDGYSATGGDLDVYYLDFVTPYRTDGRGKGQLSFSGNYAGTMEFSGLSYDTLQFSDGTNYDFFFSIEKTSISWGIVGYGTLYKSWGRWTVDANLPLPASAPLLLGGIAVLTALRRRGRKAAA